jgi:hypothetical protein
MHQNTNPVVIQDKNGKTTTVHRKNAAAPVALASSLPAPALSTPLTTEEALRLLSEAGVDLHDTSDGRNNIAYLTGHPRVFNEMLEAIEQCDEDSRTNVWTYLLGERVMRPTDDEDTYDYRNSYWRLIKTVPLGGTLLPVEGSYGRRRDIQRVTSLCETKMGWPPGSKRYSEAQAAMIAVVASGRLRDFEFKGRMDDIFFMADNLEKVIPLIPAILERRDTSQGYIKALLENESIALADGLL